jgi:hypothetical protein
MSVGPREEHDQGQAPKAPCQAKYASATSMAGPWTALAELGDGTAFNSQPTFVVPVVGTKTTTYIYVGDRWEDPHLQASKYIWLPLKRRGTALSMVYYDSWLLDLTALRYLPRQGYNNHGQVIDYELYVSLDSINWGEAVASGAFDTAQTEKIVPFPKKAARYLRFVAKSEINGDNWASAGEIDVTGTLR